MAIEYDSPMMWLTPRLVREAVERIRDSAGDEEVAHGLEDDMRAEVLRAIRDGRCSDPQAVAAVALSSSQLGFARHCA